VQYLRNNHWNEEENGRRNEKLRLRLRNMLCGLIFEGVEGIGGGSEPV
jgi:hypothetical protein